jgi:hypothetical protein
MSVYNPQTKTWLIDTLTNGTFELNYSDLVAFQELNETLISTDPTPEALANLQYIIDNIYEPCCQQYTSIIKVLPSYRNYEVSQYLQTDINSGYYTGNILVLDIESTLRGISNHDLFEYIKNNLYTDTLVYNNESIVVGLYKKIN